MADEGSRKEDGVRFAAEEDEPTRADDSSVFVGDAGGMDSESSAGTDPDLEAPIPPVTPRPSITAAIRRGSFYGDVTPRISILEAMSGSESDTEGSERSEGSGAGSGLGDDGHSSVEDSDDEELLSNKFRVYIIGFLEGMMDRLSLMSALPGASSIIDTSIKLVEFPDAASVLAQKTELLDSANLIHFSLGIPSKISKFSTETAWLIDVFNTTLKEVMESSSFSALQDIMDSDELKVRRLPASIHHVKELKGKMNMLNVLIEAEAQTQKEAMREWAKTIIERRRELKELRADNMVQYRYKADTALGTGDLCRRDFEVRLVNLRVENVRLKNDLEGEKKVHDASVEFLKKQNMDLREEAVALQAGYEIDAHNLDHMLEKMKLQQKEKQLILAELEPRYLAEMAEVEAARLETIRQKEYFFANQGKVELATVAVMRIQRIWRGFLVRKIYRKVLRKLKKKRLAAKKKAKKGGAKKKGKKKK